MASDLEDDDDDNEQDEEDDKGVGRNAPIVDVVKLPSSKDEKAVKARLDAVGKKRKRDGASANVKAGVLYIGRIPRGFYENEMRSYFSQFGNVTRLRLSRNKKTGAPKHYGFIEFDDVEVAQIVQETMDNYLLMGHLLQVKMIPQDKVHADLFKGANRKWRGSTGTRRERTLHDQPRTKEEQEVVEKKLLQRQTQRKAALKKKGIEYGFPGYQVV
ncbi:RNA-binding domain-containing protein [Tilletiaria anomala UBC 951]|uniref:RNA-binding domain-containing protein n=1 Tax=Tilletiaria anomala (strain ATCC 24038 / CBS 436.72 / UBC 951) TaxID=1037660 RepID=A0A066VL84_TILAU|nr:RNA-binding domain-containing protein [Tilletiaria anomala UBC 951]KDN42492.1 RNA-binding domain-containing protein [Tilletiaria anomala UBC 951]